MIFQTIRGEMMKPSPFLRKSFIHILIAAFEDIQMTVRNAYDKKLPRNETINYNEVIKDLIDKNYFKLHEG